jgi:hypothetical protein
VVGRDRPRVRSARDLALPQSGLPLRSE